jgi:hypothetical protein
LERSHNEEETLADANIWQLFRAYQKSLKARNAESIHHIELDYVTIEDRQQVISNYLAAHGRALFEDLLGRDQHPIVAAVTFMALMEMIKTDEVVFRQGEPFGPIWLYRKKNNLDYADEMANETVILSKDPEFKPGLIDALRERESSLAQNKAATIDAVMREAVLWASQGKMIQEDDLIAMLEGRISLSETNETPTEIQNDSSAEASPAAENKILAENASIEEINPTERLEEDL